MPAIFLISEFFPSAATIRFAEIILLGDFNENPDEQNIKLLEKKK